MSSSTLHALGLFSLGLVSGGAIVYSTRQRTAQLDAPALVPAGRMTPDLAPQNSTMSPATILQFGLPGPIADVSIKQGFVAGYERRMRNPAWVAEHLTSEKLAQKDGNRGKSVFFEEVSIPPKFRAKLADYARSGYDRGHQVPAADCKFSQQAMDETFSLMNICPQVGDGFNRDYWAHFEDFCRRLTRQYKSVRVITGPLYLPRQHEDGKWRVTYEVIGSPASVAVPTHFFKVIVADQGRPGETPAVGGFVLPNAMIPNETKLTDFLVPVDAIERASGLELLSRLPQNKRLELCRQVDCSIVVRFFENNKQKALPAPRSKL
ncbi:protein of unknown function [Taphrina deformans PYCC 5710]|uniref:Endonuclease n=1 Tax=Taphrina deformans (strain PYCC 5710 / ATCC 11124 / CBS 356.35 / IMI 108563 / JCM 9778 / NBRC 8474) TaxID=1097556 RepID=R4XG48_TAPDE|nr:protein of unknown function [Taphrina deformans PYCC 5710]|eukprot:CCG84858.1 protein of unknown function [Taphrina deformans PYCC 5710]